MMSHTSKIIHCLILTKINIAINQTIKLLTIKLFYTMLFIFLLLYNKNEFLFILPFRRSHRDNSKIGTGSFLTLFKIQFKLD